MDLVMESLSSLVGQGLITLGTAGIIAIVATVFKMSGRMSRVEGKLEVLIDMVRKSLEDKPTDAGWAQWRPQGKKTRRHE